MPHEEPLVEIARVDAKLTVSSMILVALDHTSDHAELQSVLVGEYVSLQAEADALRQICDPGGDDYNDHFARAYKSALDAAVQRLETIDASLAAALLRYYPR